MNIGEIIDNDKVGQRPFDTDELATAMKRGATVTLMCWGVHNWVKNGDKWLRFKVQGFLFTGVVYITLAWDDTFTLYFCDAEGKIVDKKEMIYVDMLIETIDRRVERK